MAKETKTGFSDLYYPILLERYQEDSVYWLATIPDLPGCMSDGETPDAAVEHVGEAKEAWLCAWVEDGYPVPEASDSASFVKLLPL